MFNNKEVALLVAYTKNNRVIGAQGKIPWNLSSERTRFKQICNGKKIIIGRKSFEEIGHGLPYCTIIIVSKNLKKCPEGCILAKSLTEAMDLIEDEEILIAGGQEIYSQSIKFADKIYATEIHADFNGDSFFPVLPEEWHLKKEGTFSEKNITYEYITYFKN